MIRHDPGNMRVVVLADAGEAGGRFSDNHGQQKALAVDEIEELAGAAQAQPEQGRW
ncbi:hypothetical protein ACW9KT_18045 [Hymenobacter sp. HD11105]